MHSYDGIDHVALHTLTLDLNIYAAENKPNDIEIQDMDVHMWYPQRPKKPTPETHIAILKIPVPHL